MIKVTQFKSILKAKHQNYEYVYHTQYNIDVYRLHKHFHYIFYLVLLHYGLDFHFKTSEYTHEVQQHTPSINFNVTYYSVFGIIIINVTIISYPLFVRRDLSPFTVFVNQYSY